MRSGCCVVLAVLGCNPVTFPATPDAIESVDAAVPDAATRGVVRATVLDVLGNGAPEANIPVVFVNPDGTIAGDVVSDSNGKVEATIMVGASVTAVWQKASGYTIITMTDLAPDEDLVLGFTNRDTSPDGSFGVTFFATPNATSYTLYGPCGSMAAMPGVANTMALTRDCKVPTFDVYVVARDVNGTEFRVAQSSGVSLADSATTIPNSWISTSAFEAHYTQVPAGVTEVSFDRRSGSSAGHRNSASGVVANGTLSLADSPAVRAGQSAFVTTTFARATTGDQRIRQRIAGAALSYGLDVAASLLPWIESATFDIPTRTLTPTMSGDGEFDMVLAGLYYTRPGPTPLDFEWVVFMPTASPFTLPTLPAHLDAIQPVTGDVENSTIMYVIDGSSTDGWSAVREHAFDFYFATFQGSSPASTIRTSTL